jgi:hypothetical protein
MQTPRYARGTRVEIKPGPFPMAPELVGRTGLVVETSDYAPRKYGIELDGESRVREFHEDELQPLVERPMPAEKAGGLGPGIG